ncbi:MAG: RES family NAD+ phosphorylase [Pseudomonadales bacterium]|nr:RES family NAD+ phosphorylase [Pseudomonadales bacterium]MCP5182977.1 RES family NAD+ phosphorylase [Pseudomonadales bacterium]
MITEVLDDGWLWWRIAEAGWVEPLSPDYAQARGGRWNPPNSHPTLYLNEDKVSARMNLRQFISGWPFEPEDLRSETGPVLVCATLPRNQTVVDAHSPAGIDALDLPATYPVDRNGNTITHPPCQQIGTRAREAGLRGVRARSAQSPYGVGRELAWFPATTASRAKQLSVLRFDDWYWK